MLFLFFLNIWEIEKYSALNSVAIVLLNFFFFVSTLHINSLLGFFLVYFIPIFFFCKFEKTNIYIFISLYLFCFISCLLFSTISIFQFGILSFYLPKNNWQYLAPVVQYCKRKGCSWLAAAVSISIISIVYCGALINLYISYIIYYISYIIYFSFKILSTLFPVY